MIADAAILTIHVFRRVVPADHRPERIGQYRLLLPYWKFRRRYKVLVGLIEIRQKKRGLRPIGDRILCGKPIEFFEAGHGRYAIVDLQDVDCGRNMRFDGPRRNSQFASNLL